MPEADSAPDRDQHMQATFWMAVTARDELIDGDLEGAKTAARSLVEHDYGTTLPERWRHFIKQMQKEAEAIVIAADLDAAAKGVSALGLTCGNCHAEHRAAAESERTLPLAWQEAETLGERMQRHEIAADQLWVGLVAPSENAWASGTLSLTRAPIEAPAQAGEPVEPALAAKIEELRGLARTARTAKSHPERAELYGKILSRCASCHQVARR